MPSLLKILSQMTGLQKLSVARNLIVPPLLLLSFTLGGGAFSFTAPIVLPWVLYMGFNLGGNSHRLQAAKGFQSVTPLPKYLGLSTKVLYILSCVVGIVYIGVIDALLPDADNAAAPQALQVALFGAVFFGVFLTIVGVRMGWSSVEACAPGTNPAKTLRLVNPGGVQRQQLIYLAAGFFVLIGSLSSLSSSYPRWVGNGSDASASLTSDEQKSLASILSGDSAALADKQSVALAPQPQAQQSASTPQQAPQHEAIPAQASNQLAVQQVAQTVTTQQAATAASASSKEDESDYPSMTPCIQRWEDAYQAERDAQGLDSVVSVDQAWEWKHWCDAGHQAPTPQQAVKSDQWQNSGQK